jgi:hypothetical protein
MIFMVFSAKVFQAIFDKKDRSYVFNQFIPDVTEKTEW